MNLLTFFFSLLQLSAKLSPIKEPVAAVSHLSALCVTAAQLAMTSSLTALSALSQAVNPLVANYLTKYIHIENMKITSTFIKNEK